jgi:hypothetical protein
MPLPPNTETLLPDLIAQYAETRREDLDLPDSTALPFVIGPTIESQEFPRVVFITSASTSPHPKRLDLTVTVELQTSSKTQVIETENAWTAGLRHILADKASFLTWLAAQTLSVRTGYSVRTWRTEDLGMAVDEAKDIRGRRTDVKLHVRTDELTAP